MSEAVKLWSAAKAVFWMLVRAAEVFVAIGLLVLIAGTVLRYLGISIIRLPAADATQLAYLCGAWALYMWKRV